MVVDLGDSLGIFIAALGGAAVGLEREWSGHASGPSARFAGIRTFTLLGLLAGLEGWLWSNGLQVLAALLLAGTGYGMWCRRSFSVRTVICWFWALMDAEA
jgi:hypothetical protein